KGKTYDSISGLSAEQRVLARDVRKLRDLFNKNGQSIVSKDSLEITVQLDQRVIQQIFKKARFVNEMMIEAFRNNVYEDPSQRLDIAFLDSVLKIEISTANLPKNYEFVITNEYHEPIEFENQPTHYNSEIDSATSHGTLLFPSNSLDEDLYLYIQFPKQDTFLLNEMWTGLALNLSLIIFVIIALIFMFKTILAQKKLSELKSDFISNMTHEFKTPISTISLACQAMNDSDMVSALSEETKPFVKMINDENKRLSLLVERILQSATLDRGELRIREENIILNEILKELVENAKFRISNSGGSIRLEMGDDPIEITGDKMHLTNVISNLIDNAIKYSNGAPEIDIRLVKEGKKVLLTVQDKGIGIKKEHLHKIFDKLYRIPTGNVHNVKGFGLGLSYVKAISDLHGWNVIVKSKHGIGTEFTLEIKV
ncbi:MAG: HAMP domain-containing histidine kinase, partial [Crocinitomicaceae bacterium]|nr:HAMP domain-containing histidine kinase [Crocinitomicaceae bacterium]